MPPYKMALNKSQCDILCAIFEVPTRSDVDWSRFESLVVALGGQWLKPGKTAGSRRKAKLHNKKGLFHSPHPGSIMAKGSVESAREFLSKAGVTPAKEDCKC